MYSDVRQNSEDGSEYLVHEIRRKMNVISAEAQPSAGIVLFIFALFFLDLPSLGFHGQIPPPPHSQRCPLRVHISCACFLDCVEKGRGKRGAVALFHLGVSTLLPSGIQIAKQIAFRAFNKSEYTFLTVFHCPDQIYPQEKREGRIKNQRHGEDSHTEPAVQWIICLGGKE